MMMMLYETWTCMYMQEPKFNFKSLSLPIVIIKSVFNADMCK